ncbi:hypothetical protein PIB30_033385 [Stylosanthes scabra]|uniref:SWIM-type domain-containing protein n=1 Tax=Stylosanthes scabra TaxID=79078 RepID=A0ABU6Z9B1_9FABA|nr:hypothetical protein [Stylosanthes scabra]
MPCIHAIAAIRKMHENPEDFVHPWLCMESIHATFKHSINHVPSEQYWVNRDYLRTEAPIIKRPIGRPKVHNRKKDPVEKLIQGDKLKKSFRVTCSKCGEKGHTYKTRKGAPSNLNWKPRTNKSRKISTPHVELSLSQSAPQPETNDVASQSQHMLAAPATKRPREKQPIRRKTIRKSPPPSEPPSTSQDAGPSVETLAATSAGNQSRFKFMQTPGFKKH